MQTEQHFRPLSALVKSFGYELLPLETCESHKILGSIVVCNTENFNLPSECEGHPLIRVILTEGEPAKRSLEFASSPAAPVPFRGRQLETFVGLSPSPFSFRGDVVASSGQIPIWSTCSNGGHREDVFLVAQPWLQDSDCLFQHLCGARFMGLVPLIEWLRSLTGWYDWSRPPLHACFIFDDPNLHAATYGFVDYATLANEGRRHGYHTAFATVPLDAYYVSSKAADIFRKNKDTLSLLIHGNNHSYRELASRKDLAIAVAEMEQAVRRICSLEHKSGLSVPRVMAPPHGVCSDLMMAAMATAGFTAACISHGSVAAGNPGADWVDILGALPVMEIAGLPIIPRFGLDADLRIKALLAAYLNQPIIPVAHHWDLAEGTGVLADAASFINTLGPVQWSDMGEIVNKNFSYKLEGRIMKVGLSSGRCSLRVPPGVSELRVVSSGNKTGSEGFNCSCAGTPILPVQHADVDGMYRFPVIQDMLVEIERQESSRAVPSGKLAPITGLNLVLRKILVELRDRTMPLIPGNAHRALRRGSVLRKARMA